MFKPDATPEEVVAWCDKQFERAHQDRLSIERQWLLNLAFYYGKQWVIWNPVAQGAQRLAEPKEANWRVRLTVNKIQAYVRREMARLSSQRPRGFVMPRSAEQKDVSAARAGEGLYKYLYDSIGLVEVDDITDWWVCICGPGFQKVRFTEEVDPSTNQPGRLRVDAIRPFDLYVENLEETRISEQKWVAHVQSLPVAEIREKFGVDVNADASVSEVDSKVRNVMSIFSSDKGPDYAVVKEFWIKPTKEFPKGLVVATANGKLLPFIQEEPQMSMDVTSDDPDMMLMPPSPKPEGTIEWPFGHGRLPFVKRGHTMSGRFYDTSFVDMLISLQREYNRSRSQIIENKNITSRPQWVVPVGTDVTQFTTQPGAIMQYVPGFPEPKPLQPPPLPNYVMEHIKVTGQEMDELASQNEVSKGSVPPGVEAATAIAYLQERDDSALTYAIRNKERAIQEVARQLLALVTEFWDVGRMVRVLGNNDIFDSYVLKGSDLRDNIDYHVVEGSGTPISRAAKEAKLMEMMKTGFLPPAKALRMIDMPDIAAVIAEVERDIVEAGKQNLIMSRGEYATVEVWQDHVAHLDEHDSFKKTEEYQHLDDQIKAIFRYHDYQHLSQLAMLFNMFPPLVPPQDPTALEKMHMEMSMNPHYVDTAHEFALRQVYMQLKTGMGAPQPESEGQPA